MQIVSDHFFHAKLNRLKVPILKLSVSLVALYLIWLNVDFNKVLSVLVKLKPISILSLLCLYFFGQILSTLKWSTILSSLGIKKDFPTLLRAYFYGMLFGTVGFGIVGADASRLISLKPNANEKTKVLASIILDRGHGLVVLLLMAFFTISSFPLPILTSYIPRQFSFALFFILLFCLLPYGTTIFLKLTPKLIPQSFLNKVLKYLRFDLKTSLRCLILSVCMHLLQILMHYFILNEFEFHFPLSELFIAILLVNLISALPISYNGLGIREAGYYFFFVGEGVSSELAIAIGATWFSVITIANLLAGLISLLMNRFNLVKN